MLRGTITVTCPNCGKTFTAPDIEWNATVYSAPVKCPHCNETVNKMDISFLGRIQAGYRRNKDDG